MAGRGSSYQLQNKKSTQKSAPPQKKEPKRTFSDVSNDSCNDSSSNGDILAMHTQLDAIASDLSDLKGVLKNMLKKDEIESLITNTIKNILTDVERRMKAEIDGKVMEKTRLLEEKIEVLQYENKQLTDRVEKEEQKMKRKVAELSEREKENNYRSKEALKKANYNEQYSRKNNIKIANIPEDRDEDLVEKVNNKLGKHMVSIEKQEILAIHRIPTRNGIKPILIKTINNDVKRKIMQKRKELKNDGHRISDDVTKMNSDLINKLLQHEEITSAWFFNGAVYGQTTRSERVKFDVFDSITDVISLYRQKQRR